MPPPHEVSAASLLNPKSLFNGSGIQRNSPQQPSNNQTTAGTSVPQTFTFSSTTKHEDSDSDVEVVGASRLIEQTHNLTEREDSPAKRQKILHKDHHKKSIVSIKDVKSGGLISEHLKEQRRKANQDGNSNVITIRDSPEPKQVIDLTCVETQSSESSKIVCLGKLDGASVNMSQIPQARDHKGFTSNGTQWRSLPCRLWRLPAQNFVIHTRDHYGSIFGTLDVRISRALAPLLDSHATFPGFRVEARLDPHPRIPNSHFGDVISERWSISLNVYSQMKDAAHIGNELRRKNVFLGAPTGVPAGVQIFNPQQAERATVRARASKFVSGAGYVTRTNEEVERDINSVFNRVKNHDDLKPSAPAPCVATPLLAHQLQCLTFMAEREAEYDIVTEEETDESHPTSLWRSRINNSGFKTYYNVITGNEERSPPVPVRGGILADQMGLGKTLETIAHCASTLEESRELSEMHSSMFAQDGTELHNIGATLIICPKNVMSNWESQIDAHLKEGSVSYFVFYGNNRVQDLSILRKHDVIITTYDVVSNQLKGNSHSILKQINWFRIILDEGHTIREQNTQRSRAVCELYATRRWVLTGTPVQNKLEDLGALVKFLRVSPFDNPSNFSQYIIAPLKVGNSESVMRLRTLVDVITLRRLKDRINLLPRRDIVMKLQFSPSERTLYNWVNQNAKQRVRILDEKNKRGGRQMGSILRLISCLRMIADHGKELVREDELPDTKGISNDNPLVLDDDEVQSQPKLLARAAYEMYRLVSENDANYCIECNKKVVPAEEEDDPDHVFGFVAKCYCIICTDCIKKFSRKKEGELVNGRYVCGTCGESSDLDFFKLSQTGVEQAEADSHQESGSKKAILAKYEKPATKTWALLGALNDICQENDVLDSSDEPPIKSVIFSEWTSHLDLLEIALQNNLPYVKYVRLDGKMTRKQQTAAIKRLNEDNEITAILISIKAGGVGINLTGASRVFVMEPNWNPAAESQAIDRVHRLGQKRPVIVTRFIMADSIEEQIVKRQAMKDNLATLSMNRKVENIKSKLESLKELFR